MSRGVTRTCGVGVGWGQKTGGYRGGLGGGGGDPYLWGGGGLGAVDGWRWQVEAGGDESREAMAERPQTRHQSRHQPGRRVNVTQRRGEQQSGETRLHVRAAGDVKVDG